MSTEEHIGDFLNVENGKPSDLPNSRADLVTRVVDGRYTPLVGVREY